MNGACGGRRTPGRAVLFWTLMAAGAAFGVAGCGAPQEPVEPVYPAPAKPRPYSSADTIKRFDAATVEPYHLGEGDQVTVQVWERPELSGIQTIGPDGVVSLPLLGSLHVSGQTRDEAARMIQEGYSRLYTGIAVTLRVEQYISNRVTVLGRVKTPGVLRFESVPTLLEVIARAGGVVDGPVNNLTHCAVIRGHDRVAWIDLNSLVDGRDLSLNLRLKANDLVLVPEDGDLPVYVLGQVNKPGPYRWTRGMSFLDALALAGGPTRDAQPSSMLLVRPAQGTRTMISQADLIAPSDGVNIGVQKGDILFVPTSVLADVGYILEKLNAFSWVFVAQSVRH